MHEEIVAWKKQLEAERDSLIELQSSGDFTNEHAGRLLNIESMLDQVAINQFLS